MRRLADLSLEAIRDSFLLHPNHLEYRQASKDLIKRILSSQEEIIITSDKLGVEDDDDKWKGEISRKLQGSDWDFRSLLLLEIADNTMGGGGESRLEQILLEQFHSHFKSSQLQLSPPLSTSVGQQLHPWLVGILSSRYYELALGFVGEIERETMRTLNAPHVKQLEPHDLAPALNSLGQLFVRWKVLALYPSSSSQATRCSLSSLVKLAIKRCVALNSATPFPLPHPPPLLIHSCEYHHLIYAKCLQDFLQNIKKFDA